jgi:hypothetical protein
MAKTWFRRGLISGILLITAGNAQGQDLFRIQVSQAGNPVNAVSVGGSSVLDLVEQAIESQGQFAAFENLATDVTLDYAGVPNAISFTKNAANTQATLSFNLAGAEFMRTFTGVNEQDLQNQIEDFLKKDGSEQVKNFLEAINELSLVAVSDGNPLATTARMANFAFTRFGIHDDLTAAFGSDDEGSRIGRGPQVRVDASGGVVDVGAFDGSTVYVAPTFNYNFNERLGISAGFLAAYQQIEEADVYHMAAQFGLPIRVVVPTESVPLLWQLTPHATVGGSGSEDFAAGGLIIGGGATSLLTLLAGDKWSFSVANQISAYSGENLEFGDDFELDPGVDQQILKNGAKVTYRFAEGWYGFAGASITNFLSDAAIDVYYTPTIGIGWWMGRGTGLQVGYSGDFGHDYDSHQLRAAFNFAF